MFYVIDLADKLIQRGFRVIYANFSWLEFRKGLHGTWPDLIVGKNGRLGLIEVKSILSLSEALKKITDKKIKLSK